MDFEISADDVRLMHLNVRSEKHGEDDVTAIDLKLQWTTSNDALRMFHPHLPEALYQHDKKQATVDGIGPKMGARVFPDLGPLKWKQEVTGLKLTISHGINAKTDLVIADCSADHFVLEPLDGGSVDIVFRVRSICKDERILGKLGMLIKRDLPVDIERDSDVRPGDVVDLVKEKTGRRQRTAEEIFGETAQE